METIKLDIKDKRILEVLDLNPNAYLSEIAKTTLTSKQVAEYRIKKFISQKVIYSFFTVANLGIIGYSLFRIHIKLKNISEEKYSSFAKHIFEEYPTFWIGFVSGSFDIIIDIWAKNTHEFQTLFSKLLKKNTSIIYSYEIFPMLMLSMHSYGYFGEKSSPRRRSIVFSPSDKIESIDVTDHKILQVIKADSRLSYEEIGRRVNLTRNSVKYRIKQLEEKKIISGYHMMIDFKHFNRLSYKIFVAYDHTFSQEEEALISYLDQYPGILAYAKLLGRWNLDIEIQPHNAKELQQFMIKLRNKFNIIKDYELIQIIEDFGLDFFPEKLDFK